MKKSESKLVLVDTVVDITALRRLTTYAKKIKKTRMTVFNMVKDGRLKSVNIDGVHFVLLN